MDGRRFEPTGGNLGYSQLWVTRCMGRRCSTFGHGCKIFAYGVGSGEHLLLFTCSPTLSYECEECGCTFSTGEWEMRPVTGCRSRYRCHIIVTQNDSTYVRVLHSDESRSDSLFAAGRTSRSAGLAGPPQDRTLVTESSYHAGGEVETFGPFVELVWIQFYPFSLWVPYYLILCITFVHANCS